MTAATRWLLTGPAFVRYRTQLDLAGGSNTGAGAYGDMLADLLVRQLITDVNAWEDQPALKRHNDAVHPLHPVSPVARGAVPDQDCDPPRVRGDDLPKWDWVATDAAR